MVIYTQLLLLVLSTISQSLAGTDCLLPANPHYGDVSLNMTDVAAFAMYSCQPGYGIVGQVSRQCGDNQAWEGEAPECRVYLPDLVIRPDVTFKTVFLENVSMPDLACALEEGCASSSAYQVLPNSTEWFTHKRTLLKFSTAAYNFGISSFQPVLDPSQWEWHQCHEHYHSFENFAHYDVLNASGEMAAEGHKASFCLADTICIHGYRKLHRCEGLSGQGISVGCTDVYNFKTDCQWIDMTDVAPGNYTFQTHLNPYHTVPELNYDNNMLNCDISYDGHDVGITSCDMSGVKIGDSCGSVSDCSYAFSACLENNTCGCDDAFRPYAVTEWFTTCTRDCNPEETFECRNGGTRSCPLCLECLSHAPYKCDCPYGYRGVLCELEYNPDECDTYSGRRTCQNNGKCVDGIKSFTCDCTGTGFTGPTCTEVAPTEQVELDHCRGQPCGQGYTCLSGNNTYTCLCDGVVQGGLCLAKAPISGSSKVLLPSALLLCVVTLLLH